MCIRDRILTQLRTEGYEIMPSLVGSEMCIRDSVGTILGPVLGATVVVTLQSSLSNGPLGEWVHVILGVIFVLCVLLFRSGIVGWLERLVKRNFK